VAPCSWQESQAALAQFRLQRFLPTQVGMFVQALAEGVARRDEAAAVHTVSAVQCMQSWACGVDLQDDRADL
jgi:hypothetical protein